jgi:hypothetical protein
MLITLPEPVQIACQFSELVALGTNWTSETREDVIRFALFSRGRHTALQALFEAKDLGRNHRLRQVLEHIVVAAAAEGSASHRTNRAALATRCNIGRPTVSAAVRDLAAIGFIQVKE